MLFTFCSSHLIILAVLHDKITYAVDTASLGFCELTVLTVICGHEFSWNMIRSTIYVGERSVCIRDKYTAFCDQWTGVNPYYSIILVVVYYHHHMSVHFFSRLLFSVLRLFNFSIVGNVLLCFALSWGPTLVCFCHLGLSVHWRLFLHVKHLMLHWGRWNSVVVVVTGLRNEWPRNRSSIRGKGKRSVSSPKLLERPTVPPIVLLSGLQGLFFGGKAARTWSWPVT